MNTMLSRAERKEETTATRPDSHGNFRYFTTPQRQERHQKLKGQAGLSRGWLHFCDCCFISLLVLVIYH